MKKFWTLAFSLFATSLVLAQDKGFQYYVFPVKGITGISRPAGGAKVDGPKYGGMIDAKYADLFFTDADQQQLNSFFQSQIKEKFPTATVSAKQVLSNKRGSYEFLPNAQCGNTGFAVDYGDTYAIAMGINRLSVYVNEWDKYADILIPVTYNIRFVQMSSGESAFTQSETIYTRYSGLSSSVLEPGTKQITKSVLDALSAAIREDAKKIVTSLIEKSAKSFNPQKTTISVVGRDGKFVIFGSGSEVGFSSGIAFDGTNEKNQDLMYDIVYATKGLAVGVASNFGSEVKRASDAVSAGDKLSFVFSQQGKDDAKPNVLVNQYLASYMPNKTLTSQQILNNSLSSILADNIGFDAPFNIIKHDPDNVLLLNQIKSEANCESTIYEKIPGFAANTTNSRPTPDFFLKLDSYNSPSYTAWGVGRVNSNTSFNTSVGLTLVDRSGVVRQAFLGTVPYSLSRSAGKGLSFQDAIEVNLKNATLTAINELKAKFKFKNSVLQIKSASSGVATLAQPLPVSIFDDSRIVHPISHAGKTVLIPVPSDVAKLVRPDTDSERVEFKGKLNTTDLIQVPSLDYSKKPAIKCDGKNGRFLGPNLNVPSGADLAIIPVGLYDAKGFSLLEADATFLTSVKSVLKDAHFSDESIFEPQKPAACYVAMEAQGVTKNECNAGKCAGQAVVGSGLKIYVNDAKVAESVVSGKFDFSEIDSELLPSFIGLKAYENHVQNYLKHQTNLFTKE